MYCVGVPIEPQNPKIPGAEFDLGWNGGLSVTVKGAEAWRQ
jgi:hypothetical protein